jgi:hypothetical protein
MDRVHLVLVPGFAGFDALGQLEYYAGVTPLFQKWRTPTDSGRLPVLHYFDNFPTAGVRTRAARLRAYLAKRVARGEFVTGDEVVLVGHSTGGLDIRRLISDLATDRDPQPIDGHQESAVAVSADEIRRFITRVVFISVPHWGTNIADWVRAHRIERWLTVANLRATVYGAQLPLLDVLEGSISGLAAHVADLDLMLAMHDTLREADPLAGKRGPLRTAEAHESASHVELWLRHMASDFSAIDDLASEPRNGDRASPAHFEPADRDQEAKRWGDAHGPAIRTRSYVTIGKRAYAFGDGEPRQWDFLQPGTSPDLLATPTSHDTDLSYRVCYRACAGGPFKPPALGGVCVTYLDPAHEELVHQWTGGETTAWDNDGIVNTASMVWRSNEDVVVVPGDHMDVVGHFDRFKAEDGQGREFQAYDLLRSASGFTKTTFGQVWDSVLAWALRPDAERPREVRRPASRILSVVSRG